MADAGVLKISHRETALVDGPVGYPVFGPGVEQIADPKRISSEIVAFQHKRRFARIGISRVTGADLLES